MFKKTVLESLEYASSKDGSVWRWKINKEYLNEGMALAVDLLLIRLPDFNWGHVYGTYITCVYGCNMGTVCGSRRRELEECLSREPQYAVLGKWRRVTRR